MTDKTEIQRRIDVMQAYLDGAEVQIWVEDWRKWVVLEDDANFTWHVDDYRIKPKEPREIWVHLSPTHITGDQAYVLTKPPMNPAYSHYIKFKEVIED